MRSSPPFLASLSWQSAQWLLMNVAAVGGTAARAAAQSTTQQMISAPADRMVMTFPMDEASDYIRQRQQARCLSQGRLQIPGTYWKPGSLSPVCRGEGWGEGTVFARARSSPHPTVAPDYRGEGKIPKRFASAKEDPTNRARAFSCRRLTTARPTIHTYRSTSPRAQSTRQRRSPGDRAVSYSRHRADGKRQPRRRGCRRRRATIGRHKNPRAHSDSLRRRQ